MSVSKLREPTDNGLLTGSLFPRTDLAKPVAAMAESSQRFATLTENDMQHLLDEKEMKNTKRVTKMSHVLVFFQTTTTYRACVPVLPHNFVVLYLEWLV